MDVAFGLHERRRTLPFNCPRSTSQILTGVETRVADTSNVPSSGAWNRPIASARTAAGSAVDGRIHQRVLLAPVLLDPRQARAVQRPRGKPRILDAGHRVFVLVLIEQRQVAVAVRERDGAAFLRSPAEH